MAFVEGEELILTNSGTVEYYGENIELIISTTLDKVLLKLYCVSGS